MTQRILVMGLPGAGKTFLSEHIVERLQNHGKTVSWLNADIIRQKFNDWDFSTDGRLRQSNRMRMMADSVNTDYVICDFVCPLPEMRDNFDAHWTVWVDTIAEGRFDDTNKLFVPPENYDFRVTEQDSPRYSEVVAVTILNNKK